MKDGKKLLSELAALSPYTVHVRAHNLLTSGDGVAALKWGSTNAYTEDSSGNPVYDWTIVDKIKKGDKSDNGKVTDPDKIIKMRVAGDNS